MAQPPKRITLADAERIALRNHPRIGSASLVAQAAKSAIAEARAPLYPLVAGNVTGVGADHSTTLAAGALQTSSLYSRVAAGVTISQLVTDFGRTANLAEAAKLRAAAQEQLVGNTRAAILIEVDQAYYQALAADTVLTVAQAVVENRRLTLRQVRALPRSPSRRRNWRWFARRTTFRLAVRASAPRWVRRRRNVSNSPTNLCRPLSNPIRRSRSRRPCSNAPIWPRFV
jgi:hypothetical protein